MYNFFNYFLLVYIIVIGAIIFWFLYNIKKEKKFKIKSKL
jgi:hypothetical protein